VSTPTPVAEVLGLLAGAFARLRIRWYLFGAQAVIVWGRPRTSADIDVTAESSPDAAPELVREFEASGFALRIHRGVEEFVARTRVLPFVHRVSGMPVDVVLAGPGLEERFLDRAIPVAFGQWSIPVLAPEDLVVTKILAGRPKDIEDVRGILIERASALDLPEIRRTLRLLEEALGQSDLLPAFERELRDGKAER
jgi:Nucleotidyl transferase AbiEii toxin, Type IV TA system